MKPAKSILGAEFRYVDAASTDIRRTFARVRREMKQAEAAKPKPVPLPGPRVVVSLMPKNRRRTGQR